MDDSASHGALLCVMSVDIGDGRLGVVNIREHSSEAELAERFVREYELGDEALETLTDHIRANKAIAVERAAAGGDASLPHAAVPDGDAESASVPAAAGSGDADEDTAVAAPPSPIARAGSGSPDYFEDGGSPRAGAQQQQQQPRGPAQADGGEDQEAQYEALHAQYAAIKTRANHRLSGAVRRGSSATHVSVGASEAAGAVLPSYRSRPSITSGPRPLQTRHQQQPPQPRNARLADLAKPRGPVPLPTGRPGPGRRHAPPPPPPVPAPALHADKRSDPALFERLHSEATERDTRRAELERRAAEEARRAWQEERDRRRAESAERPAAPRRVGAGRSTSPPPGGHICLRLHEEAHLAQQRRSEAAEAREAERAELAPWVCAVCGGENGGRVAVCGKIVKFGRRVEPAGPFPQNAATAAEAAAMTAAGRSGGGAVLLASVRVCGAARPEEFKPVISAFAARMPRVPQEYTELQVKKHQ